MTRPCETHRALFDATMDRRVAPADVQRAKDVCAACPFLEACAETHAGDREILGVVAGQTWRERFGDNPTTRRPTCGTLAGATAHYRNNERLCDRCLRASAAARRATRARDAATRRTYGTAAQVAALTRHANNYAARLEELQHLIAAGSGLGAALRHLGVNRAALNRWCQRHDHMDLWTQLLNEPGDGTRGGRMESQRRMEGAA